MSEAGGDWRARPVVIVGAGPTGLTAAALLARYAIRSIVVERRTTGSGLPRGVHVDDESMRILQHAGVVRDFLALTRPALGLRLLDRGHRTMAEFARHRAIGEHGFPQANMFHQPDLERVLRERVAALPEVELRTGAEVIGLEPTAGGELRVLVRSGAAGGREILSASAVLGCDGAASTIRGLLGIALRDLHFQERWLVVDIRSERELDVWRGVHQVCDPARAATFMQVTDGRLRFEFRLAEGEDSSRLADPRSLERLLAPWTGASGMAGLEVVRAVEYTFRARLAERWSSGRVFLLGDAAHQTPPFIGQAIGLGLRDAENLAWKLAAVLAGNAPEAVLDSYESERKPQAKALIRKAIAAGWAMTGGQDRAARLRQVALAALCRLPRIGTFVLDRPSPTLRRGPLVARRTFPGDLPGRLIPQPPVDGQRLLDDVLGAGFVVLSTGALSSEFQAAANLLQAQAFRLDQEADRQALGAAGEPLRSWLRHGRAQAVLIRPDRVVLAADRRYTRSDPARDVPGLALLSASRSHPRDGEPDRG